MRRFSIGLASLVLGAGACSSNRTEPPIELVGQQVVCSVALGDGHEDVVGPIVGGVGSHTVAYEPGTEIVVTATTDDLLVEVDRGVATQSVSVPKTAIPESGWSVSGIAIDHTHPDYVVTCWSG